MTRVPRNLEFVYHGTNEKHLREIRKRGLHPRASSGVSNYDGELASAFTSHEDFVYLSNTRAIVYGLAADGRRRVMLLEIPLTALDESLCCPDEDSIVIRRLIGEGVYETTKHDKRFDEILKDTKPRDYRADWKSYFTEFGNVAYAGVIPFSAIRRLALIDKPTLTNVVLPILRRFSKRANTIERLLDVQSDAISFIFDGAAIADMPSEEMRRLRVLRLQYVEVRMPRSAAFVSYSRTGIDGAD